MDGGRDMKKLAVVSEVFKFLNIAFYRRHILMIIIMTYNGVCGGVESLF